MKQPSSLAFVEAIFGVGICFYINKEYRETPDARLTLIKILAQCI